jgi:hypothetical protein
VLLDRKTLVVEEGHLAKEHQVVLQLVMVALV